MADLTLAPLAQGEYVLEIAVELGDRKDGGDLWVPLDTLITKGTKLRKDREMTSPESFVGS